jgi:hypothetical protein
VTLPPKVTEAGQVARVIGVEKMTGNPVIDWGIVLEMVLAVLKLQIGPVVVPGKSSNVKVIEAATLFPESLVLASKV